MTTFIVDTNANSTTDDFGGGNIATESADGFGLSLREAIGLANANAGADIITFAPALLPGGTITLGGTQLTISDDVTIDGDIDNDGTPDITIDGNASSRIFDFNGGTSSIEGLILTNASAPLSGGGAALPRRRSAC